MYIDMHAHLDMLDIDSAVANAKKVGLKIIVATGICPESNRKVLEYAKKYDIVRCSIGLYPIDAMRTEKGGEYDVDIDSELRFVEENAGNIFGIGEIGLDYKTGEEKEEQKALFRRQIELAIKLDKPIIIHSRKAEADVLDILEEYKVKVIMHCFSGKKNLIKRGIEKGYSYTIPTSVVRGQQYQLLADMVPLRQLYCETDSPFLSPFKEKQNEPAFVVESYKKVAEIKGMDVKEIANIVYSNWQRII